MMMEWSNTGVAIQKLQVCLTITGQLSETYSLTTAYVKKHYSFGIN